MSLDGDGTVRVSCCDVLAFEPKACAVCDDGVKLCEMCRSQCPECGEWCCYDHFDPTMDNHGTPAERCSACERQRQIDSGEAKTLEAWGRGW